VAVQLADEIATVPVAEVVGDDLRLQPQAFHAYQAK
jgi:hypothetical protein